MRLDGSAAYGGGSRHGSPDVFRRMFIGAN